MREFGEPSKRYPKGPPMSDCPSVLIECPGCGDQFVALLRDGPPETLPHCCECDTPLPAAVAGRFVYEVVSTWFN